MRTYRTYTHAKDKLVIRVGRAAKTKGFSFARERRLQCPRAFCARDSLPPRDYSPSARAFAFARLSPLFKKIKPQVATAVATPRGRSTVLNVRLKRSFNLDARRVKFVRCTETKLFSVNRADKDFAFYSVSEFLVSLKSETDLGAT